MNHDAENADPAERAGEEDHAGAAAPDETTARASSRQLIPPQRRRVEPDAHLPVLVPSVLRDEPPEDARRGARFGARGRWAMGAAGLGLAAIAVGAAVFVVVDRGRQAELLAARARENAALAQTVSSLNARLQAVEASKGRDELAEVRRSVGDMKAAAATSRELSAAIAQLSQRVEKLDREQGAKLDRLGQRVDQEATTRTADLTARIDRLEKKPAPAAAPPPPPTPAASPAPPKFAGKISMDPTGSIARPRPVLRGYVVLGAQGDVAVVGGRYGEQPVRPGDFLPGAGRVQRVERQGPDWIVVTDLGVIPSAYGPD